MKILLAYLDHKTSAIEVRERFSFTEERKRELLRELVQDTRISGAVLLTTCNRTELYITAGDPQVKPANILCRYSGCMDEMEQFPFNMEEDDAAVLHLMEVACGLHSMVLCEDQIITQVSQAIQTSREEKAADAVLETVFRLAVTAAKRAKTQVRVKAVPGSAAESAVNYLSERCRLEGKRVLVIGNGETGRMCCRELLERGARVTVTLRKHKYGDTLVPFGCGTVEYDRRARQLSESDIVISATLSPHYTITCDMLEGMGKKPEYFVDLALPRDIQPEVENFEGVKCFNLDDFCKDYEIFNLGEIEQIRQIIQEHLLRYLKWKSFAECPTAP
ncbi:glutamyl-tRNA reductase [Ruminiclostridium hungatei]|uniref:Glutamyl-tRNA reductase n=1 Tax=Ruminiclostridium hungatei TaxID=48256 RepID=A0A1V4SR91_RUMHU|nr:glutamyl-tRNA reductase [Ruminiclostridium hungatei]OPX45737.1 glutamyl-tRNA reductase [Ruminiclostridium hungatei]